MASKAVSSYEVSRKVGIIPHFSFGKEIFDLLMATTI
jgi:hypothetical protein